MHLKEQRKKHGYTQKQLAKILNTSEATIIRWENNYKLPGIDSLMQMSILYNVTLDYLTGLDKHRAIVIDRLSKIQEALLRTIILEFQTGGPNEDDIGLTQRQKDILSSVLLEFKGKK